MVMFRNFLTLIGAVVLPSHLLRFVVGVALFQASQHAGLAPGSYIALGVTILTALLSSVVTGALAGALLPIERPRTWAGLLAITVLLEGGSLPLNISSRHGVLAEAQADALLAAACAVAAVICYFSARSRHSRTSGALSAR